MTFAKSSKLRRCPECGVKYVPMRKVQPTCGDQSCETLFALKVIAKAERKREKIQRAADRQKLESLKPAKYWRAILKREMHLYVRLRDEGKPCISCDTILERKGRVGGDYDAGHCRSVGSAKHLEFDERNIHGQCKHCNDAMGGNYHEYRNRLPARIGQEAFDALMCDQDDRKYSIEQIKSMTAHYRKLISEIRNKTEIDHD